MSKLMLQIMGAVAEFEKRLIKERQKEGIAKAIGVYWQKAIAYKYPNRSDQTEERARD